MWYLLSDISRHRHHVRRDKTEKYAKKLRCSIFLSMPRKCETAVSRGSGRGSRCRRHGILCSRRHWERVLVWLFVRHGVWVDAWDGVLDEVSEEDEGGQGLGRDGLKMGIVLFGSFASGECAGRDLRCVCFSPQRSSAVT